MIHDLTANRNLNGVLGRIVGQAFVKQGQPRRWKLMLDSPQLSNGGYANGVEVLPGNLRMLTQDKRASEKFGAMWLYVLDEHITPAELFTKLFQHYQIYSPAFVENSDFNYKRPFM